MIFQCPKCANGIEVNKPGKYVSCPYCQEVVPIPGYTQMQVKQQARAVEVKKTSSQLLNLSKPIYILGAIQLFIFACAFMVSLITEENKFVCAYCLAAAISSIFVFALGNIISLLHTIATRKD